jgi:hypothetical protein
MWRSMMISILLWWVHQRTVRNFISFLYKAIQEVILKSAFTIL